MLGSGAKSVGLSLNVTWIFAALVVVFLEVMVIRGALQGPNTGDIASAELMGDFLNQTEQLYDHEN
jgi:hypothetical protein